jgi:hypothetical protein
MQEKETTKVERRMIMKNTTQKNRPVEETMHNDELWGDPMCYPAYDATSLHGTHGATATESNQEAAEAGSYGVAA